MGKTTPTGSSDEDIEFRIQCRGLTAEEFYDLYGAIRRAYKPHGRKVPAIRNPVLPFGPHDVHDIILLASKSSVVLYAGKKAVDILAAALSKFVEERLLKSKSEQPKVVDIFGPDEKPLYKISFKPEKPQTKKVK